MIKFPELLKEWDYVKNGELQPSQVTPFSHKKIYWICIEKHSWQTTIASRTNQTSGCPYCGNKKVNNQNNLTYLYPTIANEWDYEKNGDLKPELVVPHSHEVVFWKCKNNHSWSTAVYNRTRGTNCPNCAWIHTNLEKFIEEKLNIEKHDKVVLNNNNYRPDFKLSDTVYLNVDGLYYHSELYKERDYHLKLRESFESENKRILQFYEDEVYNKWNIVESIINNALGKVTDKIDARKCKIQKISQMTAQEFYATNHLMGSYYLASHYGLLYNNELVSCISIREASNVAEISRFGNKINTSIRGGFSKLLSYIIKLYNPSKIVSFCDLRYATGRSYEKLGFKLVGITQGWQWTDLKNRYNRLACRATLDKSEKENAAERDWIKIYDAGQAKYIKELTN